MIAVCPKCRARYRVDTTRIAPEGAKLRCAQCTALFLVRVPATNAPNGVVVVADADVPRAKTCAEALRAWGFAPHLVHDGVDGMLAIQRLLPRAVVLASTLPRMSGAEICEIVKRNASLCSTPVVMIAAGAASQGDRRAEPAPHGPDAELEPADLPDGLQAILQRCGLGAVQSPRANAVPSTAAAPSAPLARVPAPAPASVPVSAPGPARAAALASPHPTPPHPTHTPAHAPRTPSAPEARILPSADPVRDEERERARRLARIAVSEMVLYQPEKFAEAARTGTLESALHVEIQEARALIRQRIGPEVQAEADFVLDELQRVARERGGRA